MVNYSFNCRVKRKPTNEKSGFFTKFFDVCLESWLKCSHCKGKQELAHSAVVIVAGFARPVPAQGERFKARP